MREDVKQLVRLLMAEVERAESISGTIVFSKDKTLVFSAGPNGICLEVAEPLSEIAVASILDPKVALKTLDAAQLVVTDDPIRPIQRKGR